MRGVTLSKGLGEGKYVGMYRGGGVLGVKEGVNITDYFNFITLLILSLYYIKIKGPSGYLKYKNLQNY